MQLRRYRRLNLSGVLLKRTRTLISQTFHRGEKRMQDLDSSLSRSHSKADDVQS